MSDKSGLALEQISKTNTIEDKTGGQTEIKESKTGKVGRPKRTTTAPPTWSIRGVEWETRIAIEKAAEQSDKTLGEFFNQELREYVQMLLKKASDLPASPEDIKRMMDSRFEQVDHRIDELKQEILTALQQTQSPNLLQRIRKSIFGD
jgi:CRISPR/Cas system-associated endonuclease/helicase Cas3